MSFTFRKVSETSTVKCEDESCDYQGQTRVRGEDGHFAPKRGLEHTIATGHPTTETRVTVTRSAMDQED